MGLVATTIPNLINGVSQQPFALRLSSQSEEQVNTYPSAVEGLRKRAPTKHLARIRNSIAAQDAHVHIINRDQNEQYIAIITEGSLKVYTLDGEELTVNMPDGNGYLLNATPNVALGFSLMTVADYTFVVNKSRTVTKDQAFTSPVYPPEALIYVAQGAYGKTYGISVAQGGNSITSEYITPDGDEPWQVRMVSTDSIAYWLEVGGTTGHSGQALNSASWLNVQRNGSVIRIRATNGQEFTVYCRDGQGNKGMRVFKGKVQRFSDLPAENAPNNYHVEIVGDPSSAYDNYYVSYEETSGFGGAGVWRETIGQGIQYRLARRDMPHVLIREANGTFTFRPHEWADREVGDEDSAPWPSFVGRKISDVFLYRNRLGFIADENVIMSRAGEFFNFWPTTVTASLDSDPIDVAVSHNKVSILRHAIPFNSDLMLFSDQTQFAVRSGELLTPSTISVDQITEFEAALQCRPVGIGKNVYFAVNRGEWTGVREYFAKANGSQVNDALDITAHVPKYIPSDVRKIAASPNEDAMVLLSQKDRSKLWLYKYYFSDEAKLQSSWSVWEFTKGTLGGAPTIVDIAFIGSTLFLIINRPDGLYLESMDISAGATNGGASYPIHLDRQFEFVPTEWSIDGSDPLGWTQVYMPYQPGWFALAPDQVYENAYAVVAPGNYGTPGGPVSFGNQAAVEGMVLQLRQHPDGDPKHFYIRGDYRNVPLIIGFPFDFRYVFSEIALREEAVGGGQATIGAGRLQLRKMFLTYSRTGRFTVRVRRPSRDDIVYTYTGMTLGSPSLILGEPTLDTGRFAFPIQGNSADTTIIVESKDHLPVGLMGAEWEGLYHTRAQRLR